MLPSTGEGLSPTRPDRAESPASAAVALAVPVLPALSELAELPELPALPGIPALPSRPLRPARPRPPQRPQPEPSPEDGLAPARPDGVPEPRGCLYALSQPPLMLFLCVIGGLIGAGGAWDLLFL